MGYPQVLLILVAMLQSLRLSARTPMKASIASPKGTLANQVAKLRVLHQSFSAQARDKGEAMQFITFKNTQRKHPIDADAIRAQIAAIQQVLLVPEMRVDVWFCSDDKIRELNDEWRDKRESTDVLSFPANDFDIPGALSAEAREGGHLGDIVVSPAYVQRVCDRDLKDAKSSSTSAPAATAEPPTSDFLRDADAGVSLAMSTRYTLEERLPLLLVHSMLHLLGYDHETEEDWRAMTQREEEVMRALGLGAGGQSRQQTQQGQGAWAPRNIALAASAPSPSVPTYPTVATTAMLTKKAAAVTTTKRATIEHCKS